MLYISIIIIGIICGLLRGGELNKLANISIEGVLLFAIALFLRVGVWAAELLGFSGMLRYSPHLIIISYLLLIFVSLQNIKLPGFKYIILGLLLNAFVIILNGGRMPVLIKQGLIGNINSGGFPNIENGGLHYLMDNSTLFAFLGDVISLPWPFPANQLLSVGDIIILVGLFILIQKTMMKEEPFHQYKET